MEGSLGNFGLSLLNKQWTHEKVQACATAALPFRLRCALGTLPAAPRGRMFVADRENNRIQIFDQDGKLLEQWRQFGRPSGIAIGKDDTIYVADSESGPDSGANELPGIKKGIRIGSAKDGKVTAFIEDMESTVAPHSGAEGVGVDAQGNVYGAVVGRRMLERHVRK
jgi:sugar lactone lactonase YvrE